MDEMQFLRYFISAIITLGSVAAIIVKFTQPINDLKVVIQKLNDSIDATKSDNEQHHKKLEHHDEQIHQLDRRVTNVEAKMELRK